MKLKIDEEGHLWKKCAGIMKRMECKDCVKQIDYHYCFRNTNNISSLVNSFRPCGDWCPLFDIELNNKCCVISLCNRYYRIWLEEFTDERVKQEKDES